MKMEVGKFYKTKDGRKVGPCKKNTNYNYLLDCHDAIGGMDWTYTDDGKSVGLDPNSGFHIVAEWDDTEIVEKPSKHIDQMSLPDYQRGVEAIWKSMRPFGV